MESLRRSSGSSEESKSDTETSPFNRDSSRTDSVQRRLRLAVTERRENAIRGDVG